MSGNKMKLWQILVVCACALATACVLLSSTATENLSTEARLEAILSQIHGAGETSVFIHLDESDAVQGVIVVSEGGNNLIVVSDLIDAVATALNVDRSKIQIYAK